MYALRRPTHQSWLLACFCFGVVCGVIVSFWLPGLWFVPVAWAFSGGALALIGLSRRRVYALAIMLIAGSLLGLWRGDSYSQQLAPYDNLIGKIVTLQGRVMEDADTGERGEVVLRLSDIVAMEHKVAGSVWISTNETAKVKRGDTVTVRGKLGAGFGSFAASMFRAELVSVERPVPGDVALMARDWFSEGVRRVVPEPEASLGVGYVVGQRRSLPEDLDKALQATGLTHIVVASGYNLTILVNFSRRLFAKVSRFLATFFSGGMIVGFIAITGLSPSMSRAGLVAGLGLLAWHYGRRFHPLVLLPLAAAITLLVNPSYGQGDLGWQLSFAAFAGVLVAAPLLQNYFYGSAKPNAVRQMFFETVCAWVCTVPLIVLAFGQFSNVAILANLLVLPLVPLAMLLTFLAGVAALIVPPIGALVGAPALLVLGYMTKVMLYLGGVSWAQTEIEMTATTLLVYYALLIAACAYTWRKTRFSFTQQKQSDN